MEHLFLGKSFWSASLDDRQSRNLPWKGGYCLDPGTDCDVVGSRAVQMVTRTITEVENGHYLAMEYLFDSAVTSRGWSARLVGLDAIAERTRFATRYEFGNQSYKRFAFPC